jgi:hypothetical protein
MAKVLCVPYPDPESGYPPKYAREDIGTREILEAYFAGRAVRYDYLIVHGGQLAGTGAVSCSVAGTAVREAADRTLNLRTRTASKDRPRESREKQ